MAPAVTADQCWDDQANGIDRTKSALSARIYYMMPEMVHTKPIGNFTAAECMREASHSGLYSRDLTPCWHHAFMLEHVSDVLQTITNTLTLTAVVRSQKGSTGLGRN